MKKIILLAAGLMIAISVSSQRCLSDGIGFYSQEQVDRFHENYPNCREILGNVVIGGDDIMYLDGLNGIAKIIGNLEILGTGRLFDVTGFKHLKSIGGHFDLYYNAQIINLAGFDSLETIGADFEIYKNPGLTSFRGLKGLTSIGRNLWIGTNPFIPNLDGFSSLLSVGGLIQIDYNDVLGNISALGTLKTVGGEIYINSNPKLFRLFGLDSINAGTIGGLTITNNDTLSSCDILSICRYLVIPYRRISINNNAKGCNTEAEVKAGCDTLSVENQAGIGSLSIHPNPAFGRIIVEIPGPSPNTRLTIINLRGEEMMSLVVSSPEDRVDISSLPPGVYIVKLVSTGSVAVSKLVKKQE